MNTNSTPTVTPVTPVTPGVPFANNEGNPVPEFDPKQEENVMMNNATPCSAITKGATLCKRDAVEAVSVVMSGAYATIYTSQSGYLAQHLPLCGQHRNLIKQGKTIHAMTRRLRHIPEQPALDLTTVATVPNEPAATPNKEEDMNTTTTIEQRRAQWDATFGPAVQVPEFLNTNKKEEETMPIAHFLRETADLEGFALRIVTNMASPAVQAAYEKAVVSVRPEKIGDTNHRLLAVNIGHQTMPLLERAADMGVKFTFMSVPVKALKEDPSVIAKYLGRSNFAWSNDRTASFIKFDGVEGWGLGPIGLEVSYDPKLAKRLNEVGRVTSHYYTGDITIREFRTPDGMFDEYFDGMNIISKEFARKMGVKFTRGNLRLTTPYGTIKGDFVVVPGLDVDIVFHTENIKRSVRSDGWNLCTAMEHAPMHELRHDDQTRANFSFFITHDRVRDDLNKMVGSYKDSVESGGELADYLYNQSMAFDDPISVDYAVFGTSQRMEQEADRLRSIGVAPASFSNITFSHLGAITRKMDSKRIRQSKYMPAGIKRTNFFKKMFVPASNALLGAVVTYEALTLMGGIEFPNHDGSYTFFDQKYGIVMPGSRFLATYDLHGGWDLDDTVGLFLIKIYGSDEQRVAALVKAGVLDAKISVPEKEEDAIEVGLMIRRPNGPGEYSIESIDLDIPWMHYDADSIESFDLSLAPEDTDTVYSRVNVVGLPAMEKIDDPTYTRALASEIIHAQTENPGVGSYANILIAWQATFGVGSMPEEVVDRMEGVVDATMQYADPVAFRAISDEVTRLWVEFTRKVIQTGTTVDKSILLSRVPFTIGGGENQIGIGSAIVAAGLSVESDWCRVQKRMNLAIEFAGDLAKNTANGARNALPLATRIRGEKFGVAYKTAAADLVKSTNMKLQEIDRTFNKEDAACGENIVMRRAVQVRRRLATEQYMDTVTKAVVESQLDTDQLILALYKYMTTPRSGWAYGDIDRLFAQPCSEGNHSLMDMFIGAIDRAGILSDVNTVSAVMACFKV